MEKADDEFAAGRNYVSATEDAIKNMLAKQRLGVIKRAGGVIPDY